LPTVKFGYNKFIYIRTVVQGKYIDRKVTQARRTHRQKRTYRAGRTTGRDKEDTLTGGHRAREDAQTRRTHGQEGHTGRKDTRAGRTHGQEGHTGRKDTRAEKTHR
jgi:hypothetical protein